MFKVEQPYKDFLGNDQVDSLYFNISESEMYEFAKENQKFSPDYLRYILENGRGIDLVDVIREIIVLAYGELSDDGKKFRKSNERALEFVQSAAYDALFERLVNSEENDNFVMDFLIGVFPDKFTKTLSGTAKPVPINK